MALDPLNLNTVNVSQLPSAAFNLSDQLPHEVGVDLKKGTVQNLADVIGAYLDVSGGVGFRAVQVNDGETLPATTQQEFILVGKGTFFNVGGGATITTTEELNALVSNGNYWFIGVAIDVSVSLADYITQNIRAGFLNTTPSEDAVFNALADKLSISDFNDALDNLALEQRIPVNDINYNISGTGNQLISYTNITADRSVFLPPATTANQRIWIADESGKCSNARRIFAVTSGTDTISGDSFAVLNYPNGSGYLVSNGTGKWDVLSTLNVQLSSGVNTFPTITDNGDGTVTLGTGVYSLFANTNGIGRPRAYQIAGGTFTLTNNSTNFIYAEYNTTTSTVSLQQTTTESSLNDLSQVLIYSAYRQGTTLHPRNFDTWGIALANKLNRSIYRTQRVRIEDGGILIGESASPAVRTITISAGTIWVAAAENPVVALTSAANTCYHVIQTSPGVWTASTVVTQYNNTQYNTTAGLVTLTNNNYAVNWIYRSIGTDNDMAIILGGGDYTLGQAQNSAKPTNLPDFMRHMELIGRIIVKKSDNTATQIDNISSTFFSSAGVTDHNALLNLQTAQSGVTYGHITDGAQTIAGNKTYTGNLVANSISTSTTKITITTSVSITTATTDANGIGQDSRHVVIDNSTNAINITLNGGVTTTYGKVGTGAITFVQGSGRTLVQLSGTAIMNGAVGSIATLWSNGTTDYLSITNY